MGCDNCCDLGHTDDAGEVTCPECNGTGNVTEQREADRKLGAAVRAIYEKHGMLTVEMTNTTTCMLWTNAHDAGTEYPTLDEAVTRAGEGL